MTKFSTENQPSKRRGKQEYCRQGHSMEEGDRNVRVRSNGHRVCRACERDRNAANYRQKVAFAKRVAAGIPFPFPVTDLSYEPEVYENTPIPILAKFLRWQKGILERAQASQPTAKLQGSGMTAGVVVELLKAEIPKTEEVLTRLAMAAVEKEPA